MTLGIIQELKVIFAISTRGLSYQDWCTKRQSTAISFVALERLGKYPGKDCRKTWGGWSGQEPAKTEKSASLGKGNDDYKVISSVPLNRSFRSFVGYMSPPSTSAW